MAAPLTLFFPCPNCGARDCQLEETDQEIHANETYHCPECGQAVILVALSAEMLANPSSVRWDCHFCQPGPACSHPPTHPAKTSTSPQALTASPPTPNLQENQHGQRAETRPLP